MIIIILLNINLILKYRNSFIPDHEVHILYTFVSNFIPNSAFLCRLVGHSSVLFLATSLIHRLFVAEREKSMPVIQCISCLCFFSLLLLHRSYCMSRQCSQTLSVNIISKLINVFYEKKNSFWRHLIFLHRLI